MALGDDGVVQYNYASMDDAYEEMKRVNDKIGAETATLAADARKVLEDMSGRVKDGYEQRVQKLTDEVNVVNQWLFDTSRALQDAFNRMGHADQKLGDGF